MSPAPNDSARPLVLWVGGDPGDLPELRDALADREFEIEQVEDGPTSLGVFEGLAPAVVLVDVPKCEMDGAEVCQALKKLPGGERTPVLVCVDASDHERIDRSYDAGAADVVARPVDLDYMVQRLRFVLRGAQGVVQITTSEDHLDRATGFVDRATFLERMTHAMEQAARDGSNIAVLCLDLDRFRELVGGIPRESVDELLGSVAERLRSATRDSDTLAATIARVGGGEFTVLLEGLSRVEDAAKAGRRLLDELADPIGIEGREISVAASVGISSYPAEKVAPEELLRFAQTASDCAKQTGRDTVQFYESTMNSRTFERLSLETSLRHALEREEFLVYYQPRIEISSGKLLSFEALVRWQHPELGLVSPAQFIPLAEETGLIVPLGEWVLRTACAQNRAWQKLGLDPVSVSVNLSSVQFRQPELYDIVVRILGETGLDPRWLELELTESLLMQNAEQVVSTLKRFRDTGIHLSIDDFGTGYSSLSYLKRFPIDALKIDQSFIREVTTNADDAALATSIILMGRSLKLRVVAEGVETESQLSFLRIMQCDEAQGYLYSPPVPAEDAERILREGLRQSDAA